MKQNSSKKSSLNAPTKNGAKKTVGSSTKKTTSKSTTTKKTVAPKKATVSKTAPKTSQKKGPIKDKHIQKVYKNEKGKVIYRETTDKVGDILVNGAGVKFKITGERRAKPTGYDDGVLKVRVLTLSRGKQKMEFVDTTLKHYRDNKLLTRVSK